MSSPLERYLREVAVQLHELPEAEREEQIEEIRAHLTAYAAKRQAAGAGEEEAMQAALVQFGKSSEVGRRLGRSRRHGKAYLAGVVAMAVLAIAGAAGINGGFGPGIVNRSLPVILVSFLATIVQMLLIGCFFGMLLRKPAIKWVAIFYTVMFVIGIVNTTSNSLYAAHIHARLADGPHNQWLALGLDILFASCRVLFATLGAWIGARLAEKLIRRQRAPVG